MRCLTLLAAICTLLLCTTSVPAAWLTGYDHRQEIVVLPSMTGADLTDYPLLVKIADQNNSLFSTASSAAGLDIVFTKADGTSKLNREIEYYNNSGTKELDAWVRADVSSTQQTRLYMYYKGADEANSPATWNSSYRMVQHLQEDPTGPINDSTSYGNNGTTTGSMTAGQQVAGRIGGALLFDGGDTVNCGQDPSLYPSSITVEAWANANQFDSWDGVFTNIRSWGKGINLLMGSVQGIASGISGDYLNAGISSNTDQWYHLAVTHNAADNSNKLYVDGALQTHEHPFARALVHESPLTNTVIGDFYTGGSLRFNGIIDEVRVSDAVRSDEEIEATFNNQSNTAAFQVTSSQQTQGGFLEDYKYRQAITIRAGATAADLADFPALVRITDGANGVFANAASANGYDVVFTAADGLTKLNHDLESFNAAGGSEELAAWVKTPLSKDHDTVVYMYYGGPDLGDPSSSATWDDNYTMVQHLQEDPSGGGPQMIDSTSYGNDGTVAGSVAGLQQVDGQIGGALDFDGSNVNVNFGDDASLRPAQITMEAWASAESLGDWNGIITNKRSWGDGANLQMGNNYQIASLTGSGSNYTYVDTDWAVPPELDTWYHIVVTYDGIDTRLYVNGVLEETSAQDLGYHATPQDTVLGRFYTTNTGLLFNGMIDEVRISNEARDLDWILAQYRLMSDQAAYLEFAAEQPLPEPSSLVLLALGGLVLLGRRRKRIRG